MDNPHRAFPGAICDLSDAELEEERAHWSWAIANAQSWGAALSAASEFLTDCDQEILRRRATP